ncbi:MAG: IPTL-CTERM sorting domain-containing protein, partial [Candidatus Competibacteraceae bacterium]|nr:IPTL-CTERM sorting domain-containing protein [Candidatus Competibacteraceae bacterium]
DWPGWDFVNGTWVQIDDGLRPQMQLMASVNPEDTVTVSYPPASPACSANPPLPPENQPPVGDDDETTTSMGTAVSIPVLANDSDPDNDPLTITGVTQPPTGQGSVAINIADGTLTYTPAPGFSGITTFTYTISDGQGNSDTVTVTVTVTALDPFDPPYGQKVVNDAGLPELEWTLVWINPNAQYTMPLRVVDSVPNNSVYVAGSLACFANGVSTQTRCEFDAVNQQVIFEGLIGPDSGATDAASADNEIVIVFRTRIRNLAQAISNQAEVNWDADGNGSLTDNTDGSQIPHISDDPGTSAADDSTIWVPPPILRPSQVQAIPTLSEWMLLLYAALLGVTLSWHLRRQRKRQQQ